MRIVPPILDPLAHRATIDALDAQRGAYQRYARSLEAQRGKLTDGDPDEAGAAVEVALRDFDDLDARAHHLQPILDHARSLANVEQLREIQQRVEDLMHDARGAETAIRNLSSQLEVWRDAYGRQLAELGINPTGGDAGDGDAAKPGAPYGPVRDGSAGLPRMLDRQG
jgi:hypothetical protein